MTNHCSCSGYPSQKPWLSVYVDWVDPSTGQSSTCRGRQVRDACVFGVGDLPTLVRRPELFVNKFYADLEPLGLDCLEAWLRHKETCPPPFNVDYYRRLLALLSTTAMTTS